MSHELEPEEPEGTEAQTASNDEAIEQSPAKETDEQWWAGQRIENIITRLFRVTVVIVCLNMVIAGANVAMIATRWGAPRPAPSPPAQTNSVAPAPSLPAAPAVAPPAFTPSSQVAGAPSPAAPPACAPPPAPPKEALPEKPVRLLGPQQPAVRSIPVLAKSQLRTSVGFASRRPALSIGEDDGEDGPARPVERW